MRSLPVKSPSKPPTPTKFLTISLHETTPGSSIRNSDIPTVRFPLDLSTNNLYFRNIMFLQDGQIIRSTVIRFMLMAEVKLSHAPLVLAQDDQFQRMIMVKFRSFSLARDITCEMILHVR